MPKPNIIACEGIIIFGLDMTIKITRDRREAAAAAKREKEAAAAAKREAAAAARAAKKEKILALP